MPKNGGVSRTRTSYAEQAATVNAGAPAVPTRPPANTSEPIQTADRKRDPTNQEKGIIKGKDRKVNVRVKNSPIPVSAEIAHRTGLSRRKIMSVTSRQQSPRQPGEFRQVNEGCPRHNAKPTRAHTKNLLTRKIVRTLDERNFEGVADEPSTQEELMKMVSGQVREIFKRVFEEGDPILEAVLSRSSRARGHERAIEEGDPMLEETLSLSSRARGHETHRTMTRRLIKAALRKVDEEKSRKKEDRSETRSLKREASAAQFLAAERFEEQPTREALLQEERRKIDALLAIYPEAHDPMAQPEDTDDLLERYPEAADGEFYLRTLKIRESKTEKLLMPEGYGDDQIAIQKIRRAQGGNGNGKNKKPQSRPDRDTRRALADLKREVQPPATDVILDADWGSLDNMTQQ